VYEWNVIIAPILWFMIIMFACFAFLAKCWLKINKNIGVNKQLIRWPIVFSNSFTLNYSNTALWTIPNFGIGSRTHKNGPVSKSVYFATICSQCYRHLISIIVVIITITIIFILISIIFIDIIMVSLTTSPYFFHFFQNAFVNQLQKEN